MTKCVNDFRLRFGKRELVPIVVGGMGVDISTAALALEAARLGGVGHISDAMVQTVSDRRSQTHFTKEKLKLFKYNVANSDKSKVMFYLGRLTEATHNHVGNAMHRTAHWHRYHVCTHYWHHHCTRWARRRGS